METKWIKLKKEQKDPDVMRLAGQIIRSGGLVAFPTETVYGLGGDALNPESAKRIYTAKGRPSDNPLIVHICRWEDLDKIVKKIPEKAQKLADAFWPGPLTMIFEKSALVPKETTGGLETVAVRYPDHPGALAFIRAAGGYVAAPSANTSGRPSPTEGKYVYEDLNGKIELLLDDGLVSIGLESTIVDMTEEVPVILRPGAVTEEMLASVLGEVRKDPAMLHAAPDLVPKAPGMKYRHYAPKGDLTILTGEQDAVVHTINDLTRQAARQGLRTGVIATDETSRRYEADSVKSVGRRTNEASIARHLYQILREFDEEQIGVIYSEAFADTGMGQAIMNRLLKAAGHKVVRADDQEVVMEKEKKEEKERKQMVAIGCDHGGYDLKELVKKHLEEKGISVHDLGCYSKDAVDYPVYGKAVAREVASGKSEKGIVICTTGIGISISANKVKGVRAALCGDIFSARMTRLHNDANVLAMGAGIVGPNLALEIVDTFLETDFSGALRHQRRVDLIEE